MILSVSYNLYDGEELLEGSISQIRKNVDYISVVYQNISNFGSKRTSLEPFLKDLKSRGMIDEFILFVPNLTKSAHKNELKKRNIGLELAKIAGCTHFMSMDTDEFYIPKDFAEAKNKIIAEDVDASYCNMQTYYKSWDYSIYPPEEYFVSFIFKILENRSFKSCEFELLVDPTRNMVSEKYYIFDRNEIEMMHGSYIRKNIGAKLNNSSAKKNFRNKINHLINVFENWKFPDKALLAGSEDRYYDVKLSNYVPLNNIESFDNPYKANSVKSYLKKIIFANYLNSFINLFSVK